MPVRCNDLTVKGNTVTSPEGIVLRSDTDILGWLRGLRLSPNLNVGIVVDGRLQGDVGGWAEATFAVNAKEILKLIRNIK